MAVAVGEGVGDGVAVSVPLGVSVGVGDGVIVAEGVAVGDGVVVGVTVAVAVAVCVAIIVGVDVTVGVAVAVGVAVLDTRIVAVGVAVGGPAQVRFNATEKMAPRSSVSASETHNCQVPAAVCPTKPENVSKVEAWPSRLGEKRQIPFCWQITCKPVNPAPIASALACPPSVKVIGTFCERFAKAPRAVAGEPGRIINTSDWLAGLTSHTLRSPTHVCDICARNDRVVIVPAPTTGIGTHTPAALPSGIRVYAITVADPHSASGVAVAVGVADAVAVGVAVGVWVGVAVAVAVGVSVTVAVGVGVAVGSSRTRGR